MADTNTKQPTRQILFVDDDPAFLEVAKETFVLLSSEGWSIHCATTPKEALDALKQHRMDLAVVDMNMPLLDGIQFLNLLGKRYPDLKKVTLTGFATEEKRTQCLANGAELVIEKPHTPDGFKSVYAMLDDLISWAPQQGFQGMLRRVGLQDVIQMECLGRNSSVLEVHNEQTIGRIYIEDGSIIHATAGKLNGEGALQKLLSLSGGSFELVPFEKPAERTIQGQWESLLMEAARVRDENAAKAPEEPTPSAEIPTAPGAASVRVVETLICSGQGDTLYQAECTDAKARLDLLKKISEQAAQLAQMLPLGSFDRVEMQFHNGRTIAQSRPDRLIFVRTTNS